MRQPKSGKNSHGVTYVVASEKVQALGGLIEEDSMKGKHYVLLCYYCSCLYLCYSCRKEYETLTVSASHSYEINVHTDCSLIIFKDIFKTNHVGVLLVFFLRAIFVLFFLQETLCCVWLFKWKHRLFTYKMSLITTRLFKRMRQWSQKCIWWVTVWVSRTPGREYQFPIKLK